MAKTKITSTGVEQYSDGSGLDITTKLTVSGGFKVPVITAAQTLTAADSGSILVPTGTAQAFTLPAPEAGLHFKMHAGSAAAHSISTNTSSVKIYGVATNINNASASAAEGQKVVAAVTVAFGDTLLIGDFMELVSNGTHWYLHAVTNDPLTITT